MNVSCRSSAGFAAVTAALIIVAGPSALFTISRARHGPPCGAAERPRQRNRVGQAGDRGDVRNRVRDGSGYVSGVQSGR